MKVLLVGNHEFAGVPSMKIFASTLRRELARLAIDVELIVPRPVFGRIKRSGVGLGKWLGYCDRFLVFPWDLRAAAAKADVVHVCDHSDAMYASMVANRPILVTCHDMLAVRGARGELEDWTASRFGPFLQRWICRGMRHAARIACVSQYTLDDVSRILSVEGKLCLVLNGLNHSFEPLPASEVDRQLAGLPAIRDPFLLHVGSNHARKNREGVLRVFAQVPAEINLQLVFAGAALHQDLIALAKELRVFDRVVQVVNPGVEMLKALYNRAVALVFPSRYEGFGWPPIEAQACGCPVVGSEIPPLVEILGQSAVLKPVQDEAGMAESICRIVADKEYRNQLRQRGLENVEARFQTARMVSEYVSLYRMLACQE
jgi:glycosyltransferase involved in cell wall biosynthesis